MFGEATLQGLANPERFMRVSAPLLPLVTGVAIFLFAIGAPWGFVFAPADYLQGETARIMHVHVPAAIWAELIFFFMGVASLVHLVWRHALADVAARAAAPVGAIYAALCLATGSIWGAPTWGTWWVWDARLTSVLILFLLYAGYIALRVAVEDEAKGGRLAAILCLVGLINLPIVKFSVDWWSTLHQKASLLRAGGSSIDPSMLWPLAIMAAAYGFAFLGFLIAGMRAEIFRVRATAAAHRRAA